MDIKTVFLIFGIGLACFAVIVSFIGLRVKDFPSRGALIGLILAWCCSWLAALPHYAVKLSDREAEDREEGDSVAPGEEATEASHSARPDSRTNLRSEHSEPIRLGLRKHRGPLRTLGSLTVHEAVPRHHLRVPDERARFRADEGHAHLARIQRDPTRRDDADLILFNTCSIRENADNRFISHLGEAKRLKGENPERIVGVGGCWAQSVKDEVFRRFPFVDVAFGPGQIHRLAEFLNSDSADRPGLLRVRGVLPAHLPAHRARQFQGWLQISQGCNCVCSYCIVPSTRGREESRDPGRAGLLEAERLAADGVRGDHPARPERQQLRP